MLGIFHTKKGLLFIEWEIVISIAKDAAERGEAGVYKLEIAITGDLENIVPTIFYMGKFNRKSSSSEFTALADSLLRRKDVDITPADSFMISATYLDNPSLFYAPLLLKHRQILMVAL